MVKGSSDKMTKSATFPSLIEPFMLSYLACHALLIVTAFSASRTGIF